MVNSGVPDLQKTIKKKQRFKKKIGKSARVFGKGFQE